MAAPDHETSADAAQKFVGPYYKALESQRATIASYYIEPTTSSDGKALPSIIYNGLVHNRGDTMQKRFMEEMPPTHFDIQSVDSHCLNPNYHPEGKQRGSPGSGISVVVTVSGSVRLEDSRSAPLKGFSESFIIVPNPAAVGHHTRGKPVKDYIVQTQTFRLIS